MSQPGLPTGPEWEGLITDFVQAENEEPIKGKLVFVEGRGTESPELGLSLTAFYKPGQVVVNEYGEEIVEGGYLFEAVCTGPHGIGTVWFGGNKKGKNAVLSLIGRLMRWSAKVKSTTAFTQTFKGAGWDPGTEFS